MSSTINAMFNEPVARVTNFKLSADSEITTVIARQVWVRYGRSCLENGTCVCAASCLV